MKLTTSLSCLIKWRRCKGFMANFFINLVNFDLVNTDFSLNFLKFKQFNRILSDPK